MNTIQAYTPFRLDVQYDSNFTSIENALRNYGTRSHILNEDGTLAKPIINTIVLGHATFNKGQPGDLKSALQTFAKARDISAHNLVHHEVDKDGIQVFQLVDHSYKAWFSGVSAWGKSIGTVVNYNEAGNRTESKQISMNDNGIGVWLVAKESTLTEYSETQINESAQLINSLMAAYHVHPLDVVGYHDVALCRVYDPAKIGLPLSVKLPWPELIKLTPGLSAINAVLEKNADISLNAKFIFNALSADGDELVKDAQVLLHKIGYAVEATGKLDDGSKCAIHAFNMHFNQAEFGKEITDEAGWTNVWTDRAQHIAENLAALREPLVEPTISSAVDHVEL